MICTDKGKSLSAGEHFLKKAGGAPTNVAAAIAALGGSVALAAKVGEDPFGRHLMEVLNGFGVNTRWMLTDPGHFTTIAFVSLMENGERDFHFNRGADGFLTLQDIRNLEVETYPIIHFGSATAFLPGALQETYRELLDRAVSKNAFISFDPNYRSLLYQDKQSSFVRQSIEFIRRCDFFKVSDEEALLISGRPTVSEAAAFFRTITDAVFAITLGREGTLLGIGSQCYSVPSIPVEPVDTTGAGDAFVGAVLYQLQQIPASERKEQAAPSWKDIIYRANKAGARTCTYLGAMEAFRHLSGSIFD